MNSFLRYKKNFFYFVITLLVDLIAIYLPTSDWFVADSFWVSAVSILVPAMLHLFWFRLIVNDSGLLKTIYGKVLMLGTAIIFIGALAKLEHYSFARWILSGGLLFIGGTYLIRFLVKKGKTLLDVFKFIYVEVSLVISLSILGHYISSDYNVVTMILFYNLIFLFALQKDRESIAPKRVNIYKGLS